MITTKIDCHTEISAACFNVATGDVEDAPALDPLAKFEIIQKNGGVYIKGDKEGITSSRRNLNLKCQAQGQEKILVLGGYVCIDSATNQACD